MEKETYFYQNGGGKLIYKFNAKRKSYKAGINAIVYVLSILFTGIVLLITFNKTNAGYTAYTILAIAYSIFILSGIYRAIYYFNLHKKDYLIITESSLLIYRGNFVSRKVINFNQIERVVQVDGMLIVKLDTGKEEQINLEWLSEQNILDLKKEFTQIFGSNTVSF